MTSLPTEARFFAPEGCCPHPHYWHSVDDESTEVEVSEMLAGIVRGLQPDFCLETGAAFGQTSEAIGRALLANGHGHLVSLETDPERVMDCAVRCEGLPVEIIGSSSMDWQTSEPIDFAFFDSALSLRVDEFHRFLPLMHSGTFVAFHDTRPAAGGGHFEGTKDLQQVIDEQVLPSELIFFHLHTARGVTIGMVP